MGAEDDDSAPDKLKLFKNRPNMTFDDAGACADQEFSLVKDFEICISHKDVVVSKA